MKLALTDGRFTLYVDGDSREQIKFWSARGYRPVAARKAPVSKTARRSPAPKKETAKED